jgi:hypothetical protein
MIDAGGARCRVISVASMLHLLTRTNREPLKKVAGSGASFNGLGENHISAGIVCCRLPPLCRAYYPSPPRPRVLRPVPPLKHDTKRSRMLEDDAAIAGEVLIKSNAVAGTVKEIGEYSLAVLESGRSRRSSPSSSIRSKAQNMAAWSRRRKRSALNTEWPRSSTTIASLSTTHDRTERLTTAAAILGKRAVKS